MTNQRDELPLAEEGTDVEKFLLRSAELDQGSEVVRQKVLQAVAKRPVEALPMGLREKVAWGIAAAAAAGLAVSLSQRPAPQSHAVAERPSDEAASAPAGAIIPKPDRTGLVEDPCRQASRAIGARPRIDRIFENESRVAEDEGRFGTWFVEHDGTGIQKPAPGAELSVESLAPAEPAYALVTSGSQFREWGASLGLQLAGGGCYDASVYEGISIEARGPARIEVLLQTIDVVPVEEGGTCRRGCYASHYKKLQLSGKFERYDIFFDDLVQHKFGSAVKFDPARLRSIVFHVAAEDTPFDFAVSEVSFLK